MSSLDIQGAVYRMVVFRSSLRRLVLDSIKLQIDAGIPIVDVFKALKMTTDDHTLKRLADVSLSSTQVGQPFAARYHSERFFNARDAGLLVVGEQHNALSALIRLMSRSDEDDQSFWGVVVMGNAQWILGVVALVAMTMYGVAYERLMTVGRGEPAEFFQLGHWFNANIGFLFAVSASVVAVYLYARYRMRGQTRIVANQLGLFAVYDAKCLAELCDLLAALFSGGTPHRVALEIVYEVFSDRGQKRDFLSEAIYRSLQSMRQGRTFLEALGEHILDRAALTQLTLQAPRQTGDEFARAFGSLGVLARYNTAQTLKVTSGVVATACALGLFGLLMPLIEVVMGTNLNL
jgi:hypothetical protein